MSIFVSNEVFSFDLRCKKIYSDSGQFLNYKISDNGDVTLVCRYIGRSFNKMSKVIEDASIINSVTGKPMLRTSVLCKLVISNFVKSITINDGEDSHQINIDSENVNSIHYDIVKEIAKKWLEKTNGN